MVKALQVIKTGELFRLSDQRFNNFVKGVRLECSNALIWKGRGGNFKRVYDREVLFVFDPTVHRIKETSGLILEELELQRAKELCCWKYHRNKCDPPSYEERTTPVYKSVAGDLSHWEVQRMALLKLCLEYLDNPGKFDRTKLSMLRFDLGNMLDYFKRHGDGGLTNGGKEKEGAGQAPP